MSFEAKIHEAQTKILRELLFLPAANFATLQKASGLESDHIKFHIKRLVELGYVQKVDGGYCLSVKGKEYANKLDTDAGIIERQPNLLQQRLKHPYYGFWGAPTGKVRWAESIVDAASRELTEETGLRGEFVHRGVYHERVRHAQTGEIIEDKIFHLMFCKVFSGKLAVQFEGGRNAWRTLDEMRDEPKKYKSFLREITACINGCGELTEIIYEYGSAEF